MSSVPRSRLFWPALVVGWGMIGFGLYGTIQEATRTHPGNFALWFVGSALAHDMLLAPAVFALAVLVRKWVPARVRPTIQTGLIVAGSVAVVALPFVLGRGGPAGNPSALPRNYPLGLGLILAAVALATAVIARRKHRTEVPTVGE
ncbi:MAG: hypothetical protein ACT4OM_03045 [Actinomycetota bacterium]